jgi:hypothetical protein
MTELMPESKPYSPPQAEEEAGRMHAKIVSQDADSFSTAEKKVEQESLLKNLGIESIASIDKARNMVREHDSDGSKIAIFERAIRYYSRPQEELAKVPISHSTGSYALARVINEGELDSKKNVIGGETAATGSTLATTSFVLGGYEQSDVVSHFYARKSEHIVHEGLDAQEIVGIPIEHEIVKTVFDELPRLSLKDRKAVMMAIAKLKQGRNISDQELMEEKMIELQSRRHYFNEREYMTELQSVQQQMNEVDRSTEEGESRWWGLQDRERYLRSALEAYAAATPEMRKEIEDPFPVILSYEGSALPDIDINTVTPGLVSERQTSQSLSNALLRRIQVPLAQGEKVQGWIKERLDVLPSDSPEREAYAHMEIVPLEYFEAKRIIQEAKDHN